jgi:hypothetical protein
MSEPPHCWGGCSEEQPPRLREARELNGRSERPYKNYERAEISNCTLRTIDITAIAGWIAQARSPVGSGSS